MHQKGSLALYSMHEMGASRCGFDGRITDALHAVWMGVPLGMSFMMASNSAEAVFDTPLVRSTSSRRIVATSSRFIFAWMLSSFGRNSNTEDYGILAGATETPYRVDRVAVRAVLAA